ncbi:MAG: potassium channel protein [Flavobacteriales bacterium]|jgi:voltage-gated potassium channel|nr:potassium channel protein [Flavobacteriales bacterium]
MKRFNFFSRIYFALLLLLLIFVIGISGFVYIEGYSLNEAFYMTVITVSSVGFGVVRELSAEGRIFTSFLIIISFGTFAYAISVITTYVVSGEFRNYYKDYRVNKSVENMSEHIIVCGYGRNGRQAAESLKLHNENFLVIEKNLKITERMRNEKSCLFIEGDATLDDVLGKAQISKAKALITALPNDADNLFVVLSARQMNPKLNIISRASETASYSKLKIAGANSIIMPDKVGGEHMASLVTNPDVMEFLDMISIGGKHDINLEEISYNELPKDKPFRTIRELSAAYQTGCMIVGFKTTGGEFVINPAADTELVPNSKLFVLGKADQIKQLNKIFNI